MIKIRYKRILYVLLFVLCFAFLFFNENVKAEVVRDQNNSVIYYPASSTIITMPEYEKQTEEFRGVWCSFFAGDIYGYQNDTSMKKQLLEVLSTMEKFNLNAIMFHIRTHNDALYDTELAPMSSYIRGMDFERFDYLEWFINECHKRGIEFHAWLNPYRISSSTTVDAINNKYKDYKVNPASDINNVLINKSGAAILDPGRPIVQDYIVDVCMEIIEKYDVDAIHFDDYFYIEDVDDSETRKLYNTNKLSVANFRRESVDKFIKKLSDAMYDYNINNNRCVQLGISPSGIYQNYSSYVAPSNYKYNANGDLTYPLGSVGSGYSHYDGPLYCDTKKWIDNEWIDYIIPQVYHGFDNSSACYAAIVEWWNGVVKNKKCNLYIGTGLYRMNHNLGEDWSETTTEWINQLRFNQSCEYVKGTCIYQYKTLTRNINSEMITNVLNNCFTNKTKLPDILRYKDKFSENNEVNGIEIYKENDSIAIKWDKLDNVKNYLIYRYVNSDSLNEPTSIVGMIGNCDLDACIFNIKDDAFSSFAIVPINSSNEQEKAKIVNVSEAKDFNSDVNNIVRFEGYFLTGVPQRNARLNIRFYEATILYGADINYKVYMSRGLEFNEDEKEELEVNKLSDTYYSAFAMDKYGCPITLRIYAYNDFGSMYSEDIVINIKMENSIDMFKDIFMYIDEYLENIFN